MDIKQEHRREVQLDMISSLLVIALLVIIGFMLYLVSQAGIVLAPTDPLSSNIVRILLAGFTILVLLYLWDQRQRLRTEVERKTVELGTAAEWLALSHEATSILGTRGVEQGLNDILGRVASLLGADAAAVVGEDVDFVYVAEGVGACDADRVLMHVVIEAVGRPAPMLVEAPGVGGHAVAVPIRVAGELCSVLCAWRRRTPFSEAEMSVLGLVGRTVELAMDREQALADVRAQIEGTLRVLQYLGADRSHDYARHAMRVAELCERVAAQLGMTPSRREQVRLAGLLHDVGLLSLPADVVRSTESLTPEQRLVLDQHPRIGAEIAMAAGFSETVQRAILGHHERSDGTGFPSGFTGSQQSIEARLLGVCEAYDASTSHYPADRAGATAALRDIQRGAGAVFDKDVVRALASVLDERVDPAGHEPAVRALTCEALDDGRDRAGTAVAARLTAVAV